MGSSAKQKTVIDEDTAKAAAVMANDPSMGNPNASSGIIQRSQARQEAEAKADGTKTASTAGSGDGVYAQVLPGGRSEDAPAAPEDEVSSGGKGILGSAAARRRSRFQAGGTTSITI